MPTYNETWKALSLDEKVERLHEELTAFINHYNNETVKRNDARADVIARLRSLEETVRRK
jgi:hypothetical protein